VATTPTTFGDLLRQYRRAAGLTQEELADRAQVSPRAISDLERGARSRPWRETIGLIAGALGLSAAERAKLEAAARQVGRAEPAQDAPAPDVAGVAPRHNLPVALTSFVGRERELAEVKRLLATTRLLTLTGTGGCGKTRLALRVTMDVLEEYPDGVWLVELAVLADPSLVPSTVAEVLGVRSAPDQPIDVALQTQLRERRLLLVLDNCEHLIDACAGLAHGILRGGLGPRILATSREALGIDGEVSWRVPSLAVPSADAVPSPLALARTEAVQVFVDRAVAARPDFTLTKQNAAAIAQICRRLDGIPLAIELAATRVRSLAPEQIAARLDQRFSLLTGGSRAALPRQQTLAALVGWSYDLLSADERRLFDRLSVFADGFTLEAAEVLGARDWVLGGCVSDTSPGTSSTQHPIPSTSVVDLLASLVDKSLVIAEGEAGGVERYRMLETLRAYGRERLVASGEAAETRDRHADYFLGLAEDCDRVYTSEGPGSRTWYTPLVSERANLRAALAWYRENDPSQGLCLAVGLSWIWVWLRDFAEGEEWLETFLARVPGEPEVRGRALLGLGTLKRDRGQLGAAQPLFEEALALCQQSGDSWGLARCLVMLGHQARSMADYDRAIALGEESLTLARQIRVQDSIAWGLGSLAQFYRLKRDYDRARAYAEELARLEPNDYFAVYELGLIAEDVGDYERAEKLFQEGIDRRLGRSMKSGAWWRRCLSRIARKQGDRARARQLLEEDLALARQTGEHERTPWLLVDLADLERAAGGPTAGRSRLAEGLDLAKREGNRQCIAYGLLVEARRAQDSGVRLRSVRLFGAADAALPRFQFEGDYFGAGDYERILNELRAAQPPDAFAAAWAEGQAMAVEEAIALAVEQE
jgi:non-specific serine/threonine protein kinase